MNIQGIKNMSVLQHGIAIEMNYWTTIYLFKRFRFLQKKTGV